MIAEVKEPLIAALYGRVSTGRQENEATIESQVAEVKARIIADGNVLPDGNIFIDDGWTGEMFQRPALDNMRDVAAAGKFQILYVYDRGRIARKFAYQEIIIEELTDRGILFVTLHDVNAVTPEEHVLQAMQGVFHEYERIKIAERMRRGKLYKARNGIVINGSAPYGYKYIKKTETTPTHFEINEEEAEVVRKIFNWVGEEKISLNNVIRRLYDLGIKPKKRKSDFWTKGPILRMLKSDVYHKGVIYYNKSEACVAKKPIKNDKYKKIKRTSKKERPFEEWIPFKVEPIIKDDALFEKVQDVVENNKRYARAKIASRYQYLLSGLIYCSCGERRAGDGCSRNGHFYYRCVTRTSDLRKVRINNGCEARGVNAAILDGMLWRHLRKCLTDDKFLRQQAEQWLIDENNRTKLSVSEKDKLLSDLKRIKDEQERYVRAYGAGALDFEQLKELTRESKKRIKVLQNQLQGLTNNENAAAVKPEEIDSLCEKAKGVVAECSFDDKKRLVNDIIDKVVVDENDHVTTYGHLPLFAESWDSQVSDNQKLGLYATSRNCWIAKCREKHLV